MIDSKTQPSNQLTSENRDHLLLLLDGCRIHPYRLVKGDALRIFGMSFPKKVDPHFQTKPAGRRVQAGFRMAHT